jgi:hypothetical protein
MNYLRSMIGKTVELEISGNIERVGILIDYGLDIVVVYDGVNYVYIPFGHIQNVRLVANKSQQISEPDYNRLEDENDLSYRKVLQASKGMFVEIFVAGNQSIHGYVTSVQTDYFVFFSPVHNTLFIPMFHLKWLIPYPENQSPYTLDKKDLPVHPTQVKLYRTFEEQLKSMEGKIAVFDLGSNPDKIGLLKSTNHHLAELVVADQTAIYWNIHHIKMVNFPHLN